VSGRVKRLEERDLLSSRLFRSSTWFQHMQLVAHGFARYFRSLVSLVIFVVSLNGQAFFFSTRYSRSQVGPHVSRRSSHPRCRFFHEKKLTLAWPTEKLTWQLIFRSCQPPTVDTFCQCKLPFFFKKESMGTRGLSHVFHAARGPYLRRQLHHINLNRGSMEVRDAALGPYGSG
jgi:hypothetical protein